MKAATAGFDLKNGSKPVPYLMGPAFFSPNSPISCYQSAALHSILASKISAEFHSSFRVGCLTCFLSPNSANVFKLLRAVYNAIADGCHYF
jgi:hypothetical protein